MLTKILRVGSASIASAWLAACGSADKPPPPVEESVFRDVAVTPIEKAKNVQNVVDDQKRATDQAVQQQADQ